jgi:hypothetical protein
LAANNSKSGFEDVKSAVTSATMTNGTAQSPIVIVATNDSSKSTSATQLVLDLIIFIILLVIILVIGLWLWNNLAAKYITIFKPLPSVWHLLGLIIIIDLIHPGCQCSVRS